MQIKQVRLNANFGMFRLAVWQENFQMHKKKNDSVNAGNDARFNYKESLHKVGLIIFKSNMRNRRRNKVI